MVRSQGWLNDQSEGSSVRN